MALPRQLPHKSCHTKLLAAQHTLSVTTAKSQAVTSSVSHTCQQPPIAVARRLDHHSPSHTMHAPDCTSICPQGCPGWVLLHTRLAHKASASSNLGGAVHTQTRPKPMPLQQNKRTLTAPCLPTAAAAGASRANTAPTPTRPNPTQAHH